MPNSLRPSSQVSNVLPWTGNNLQEKRKHRLSTSVLCSTVCRRGSSSSLNVKLHHWRYPQTKQNRICDRRKSLVFGCVWKRESNGSGLTEQLGRALWLYDVPLFPGFDIPRLFIQLRLLPWLSFLSFQWLKSLDLFNATFAQLQISSFPCLCILGGHTRYTKMGSLCHMLIYYVYVRPFVCYFSLVIHHYMYLSSSTIWSSRMGYIYGVNRWWDSVWLICSHNFLLSLFLICSTFKVSLLFVGPVLISLFRYAVKQIQRNSMPGFEVCLYSVPGATLSK